MVCDGNNCSCIQNGVVTASMAQGGLCGNALGGWTTLCNFPQSQTVPVGDGGVTTADGGTGGGCGSAPACSGSGGTGGPAMCNCMLSCTAGSYNLSCDGNSCTCVTNGVIGAVFGQGTTCTNTLTAWVNNCHFPVASTTTPDGGVAQDGGTPCTRSCGGGTSSCSCNESCNGHSYALNCTANSCVCNQDGTPQQFVASGTPCSGSDWTSVCLFP
jgi:hypothetical protein